VQVIAFRGADGWIELDQYVAGFGPTAST
jgi:hypothetical protein